MAIYLGNTAIKKVYLGATEIKKIYQGTTLLYSSISEGEVIIRAGNTVGWYDSQDLTTITKNGSNLVSRQNDKLLSGRDLIQATAASQPIWSADGVLFDGGNDFMKTAAFNWIQPAKIYMVFKQVSWTIDDILFDGVTANISRLRCRTASPHLNLYAGSGVGPQNADFTVGDWHIGRFLFNGLNSSIQCDSLSLVSGNASTGNAGGFTLGSRGDGAINWANIQVKEIICRNVADTSGDETAIYNYLATKYGFATI